MVVNARSVSEICDLKGLRASNDQPEALICSYFPERVCHFSERAAWQPWLSSAKKQQTAELDPIWSDNVAGGTGRVTRSLPSGCLMVLTAKPLYCVRAA